MNSTSQKRSKSILIVVGLTLAAGIGLGLSSSPFIRSGFDTARSLRIVSNNDQLSLIEANQTLRSENDALQEEITLLRQAQEKAVEDFD